MSAATRRLTRRLVRVGKARFLGTRAGQALGRVRDLGTFIGKRAEAARARIGTFVGKQVTKPSRIHRLELNALKLSVGPHAGRAQKVLNERVSRELGRPVTNRAKIVDEIDNRWIAKLNRERQRRAANLPVSETFSARLPRRRQRRTHSFFRRSERRAVRLRAGVDQRIAQLVNMTFRRK